MPTVPTEPTLAALPHPLQRYIVATRPPFLSATVVGVLIGLACAFYTDGGLKPLLAIATLVFAVVAQAAANVFNDYYDDLNGTDPANTERVFPFTGGSRVIQNGVLTAQQMLHFGIALTAVVVVAGLWLMLQSGPDLLWIGAAGLFIGWAYSAPPFRLNSRGLGELCIWAAWTLLAVGAYFVQHGSVSSMVVVAAVSYALLVTNILYINQFPDRRADAAAGKRHWVVRLGAERGRWAYAVIAALAHGWLALAALAGLLPWAALLALLSAPLSVKAGRLLLAHADAPRELAPALPLTIGAALLHGLALTVALIAARLL